MSKAELKEFFESENQDVIADLPEIFDAVAALLRKGWCQGSDADDASGDAVPVHSRNAVKHCFRGAIRRVCPGGQKRDGEYAKSNERLALPAQLLTGCFLPKSRNYDVVGYRIIPFNDRRGRKKSEMVALAKKCATELRKHLKGRKT